MKTNSERQTRAAPKNGFTSHTIRAFLVDDDPFVLALLAQLLARDERVIIVGSATDGRKAFQPAAMSYSDLVLLDLHMPGLDGAQVTRWLKQLQNPPVVFVVTSDTSAASRARCVTAGADAFLEKAAALFDQLETAIQKFFPDGLAETIGQPDPRYEPITRSE